MACEEQVTIKRLKRGYVVVSRGVGLHNMERAYENIEDAVEAAVLSLGDGSFYGYPIRTKVDVCITKPDKEGGSDA